MCTPPSGRPSTGSGSAGRGRVVLIDDDEAVRDAVGLSLETTGFDVRSFASVEQFQGARAAFSWDSLIVDVDLAGIEVLLGQDLQPVRITILTSRRLRPVFASPPLAGPGVVWLQKPFGIHDLLPLLQGSRRRPE